MRLTTEEYCDKCWKNVIEYTEGVLKGNIIVGKYIKKAIIKYISMQNDERYIFRGEKINKIFKFFSFLNIENKNVYGQFKLMQWQVFLLAYVFGFYYKTDPEKRVVKEALLFIGRKNGKTSFAASIQLFGMLGDGVINPQSLLLANTSAQASISLNYAKDIIVHTPQLRDRLIGQRSRIIYRDNQKQGFCQIFSTVEPARLEGYSPSMAILDEIHNWEDNKIYAAVKTGTGARKNPLLMIITTAGNKNNAFCNEYLQYHKNILDGNVEDNTTIALIYQPDEEDDLSNSDCWIKANPSLGIINNIEDLLLDFHKAQYNYADKYIFITKHLNIFWDEPTVWIPEDELKPLFIDFKEEDYYGRDVYLGMDLSKNTDLSSVVMIIPDKDIIYVVPYFWIANRQDIFIRKSGKDLYPWIYDNHIIKCESKVIDIDKIYEKIIELSTKFNVVQLAYDPYNAPQLMSKLKDYGINCEIFKQTAMKFNAPLKTLENMIYNRKILFKNPVLLWNFLNVVLYVDGNQNIKIIKNSQRDSVDGVVALGMAIGALIESKYGAEIMGLNQYLDGIKK